MKMDRLKRVRMACKKDCFNLMEENVGFSERKIGSVNRTDGII
jgi:hypothetical protein